MFWNARCDPWPGSLLSRGLWLLVLSLVVAVAGPVRAETEAVAAGEATARAEAAPTEEAKASPAVAEPEAEGPPEETRDVVPEPKTAAEPVETKAVEPTSPPAESEAAAPTSEPGTVEAPARTEEPADRTGPEVLQPSAAPKETGSTPPEAASEKSAEARAPEAVPKVGPERTLIPIDIPKEFQPAPAAEAARTVSRADESPRSAARRTRTSGYESRDEYSQLSPDESRKRFEDAHYAQDLLLQQLADLKREQGGGLVGQLRPGSAKLAQIEAGIKAARDAAKNVQASVQDALPGDEPEIVLERANLFFRLGAYKRALNDYLRASNQGGSLDDSDHAWVRFQIAQCEKLLGRAERAHDKLDELNRYFTGRRGYRAAGQTENKIRYFDEDPDALLTWSTGFWRRRAVDEMQSTTTSKDLQDSYQAIQENRKVLQARAEALLTQAPAGNGE